MDLKLEENVTTIRGGVIFRVFLRSAEYPAAIDVFIITQKLQQLAI